MSLATNLAQIPNITVNRIPRATATGFANSAIFDNGTNVGIGGTSPSGRLDVQASGTSAFTYYFRNSAGGYGGGIYNTGSNNTQLYLATSSGTENVVISASGASYLLGGNFGIGTSNPQDYPNYRILHIAGPATNGSGLLYLTNSNNSIVGLAYAEGTNSNVTFGSQTNHPVRLVSNDTERMRITSGGNILIGTTSDNNAKLQVNGQATINGIGVNRTMNSGWGVYSAIEMHPYSSIFAGDDGFRAYTAYTFGVYSGGGWSPKYILSNSWVQAYRQRDGAHEFLTAPAGTAGNAISFTQVMTITNGGKVMVNTTDSGPNAYLFASANSSQPYPLGAKAESSTQGLIGFFNNGNSTIGSITCSGSSVAYNTSSDYRLKQDFKSFDGMSIIRSIKVYDFEWKSDSTRMYGAIAHELQEVIPYMVWGEKDAETMQSVDYSKLVPVLIKGLQEQQEEINSLKSQLGGK